MILAQKLFINPSDSLAILAQHLDLIPFYEDRVYGVARSMPTSSAVDDVAKARKIPLYKTPTGWKFFANLLAYQKASLCGEESFGAGSFHVMEKDGLWAVLAWLNIMAKTGKNVAQLAHDLWSKYGRVYYARHDYENVSTDEAKRMMDALASKITTLKNTTVGILKVKQAELFVYTDPVTKERVSSQGIVISFTNNSSVMIRMSGTGTVGTTIRMYFSKKEKAINENTAEVLAPVILAVNTILQTKKYLGLDSPTNIT